MSNILEKIKNYFNNPILKPQQFIHLLSIDDKNEINQLIKHLPLDSAARWSEKIFWIFNNILVYPNNCLTCKKNIKTGFKNLFEGYNKIMYCSNKCRNLNINYKNKLKESLLLTYGVTSNLHIPAVKEKTKTNWIKKYGVDNPMKNLNVQQQCKNTNLARRGVEYPAQCENVRNKYKQTCLVKYGVDNVFKTNKSKITCLKKYGVQYPIQNPDIFNTSTYKRKTSQFPISKIPYNYQGYENIAIKELCNIFDEKYIIIGDAKKIPIITYFNPIKNKLCVHYPDIFISSENLLIDVKSNFTFEKNKQINLIKQESSKLLGFRYEIWICSKNEVLYKIM